MAKKKNVSAAIAPHDAPINVVATIGETPSLPPGADEQPSGDWSSVDQGFLAPTTAPAPCFPIDALGPTLRTITVAFAEARRLAPDYVVAAILAGCAAAIGNRARLLGYDNTAEPLTSFTALVGPPSCGKSFAISLVERPLRAIDEAIRQTHKGSMSGVDPMLLGKIDRELRETVARRLVLEELPVAVDGPRNKMSTGIVLNETTGAGLLQELSSGIEGRALIADELVGALAYGAASQGVRCRSLMLKGYDGRPHTVTNAKGRVEIPCLLVTILGAVQPTKLPQLLGDGRDGLAARMWWVCPDVMPLRRLPKSSGPVDELSALLSKLVAIPSARTAGAYSALVPLDPDARAPIEAAADRWASQQQLSPGLFGDTLSRAVQHVLRLSGLLAVSEHAARGEAGVPKMVGIDTVEAAIHLIDSYLLPMAERTLGLSRTPEESDAVKLARHFARLGKPVVNIRADVLRAAGSPLRDPERVTVAIEELRQRGFVRPATRNMVGRPSRDFEVHPGISELCV